MSIPGLGSPSQPGGDFAQNIQYQREAPDIEARRMQLMDVSAKLAGKGITGTGTGEIQIPTQQVAGFDPLQTQAFGTAQAGVGSYMPYMQQAAAQTAASTAAYDPTTGYQQYMNPYQQNVTAGIESQFQKMQNQAAAQAGQVGAFGGARQGVQTAELGRQQAEAVGQSLAMNYGQAQQQAQQQFQSQMGRQAAAGQTYAGLGMQQQQLQQGDVAGLMAAGATKQQREQQIADSSYRQKLQQLYEPFQRIGFVSDIYQGAPSSGMAIAAGTTPQTNPLAQAVGAGITGLAAYQGYQNMMG
jgi:hypothetical protein